MRNLKRALSLALASVMLVGMMVVGTSAASYPDVDSNDNVEAIEVLKAVGAMVGDDAGNFNPDNKVTRNEMAAVMARLILGPDAEKYVGTCKFTDVPNWAQKYVAACYDNKIVNGTSDTTFDGSRTVTGIESAVMMLRALGYDITGASWEANAAKKANEIRLFKDVNVGSNAPMDRNSVAQLALNGLKSDVVTTTKTGGTVTLPDGTVVDTGSTSYDLITESTYDYNSSSDGIRQLCEKLYEGDLALDDSDTDDMSRPASTWSYKNDPVITVANKADYTVVLKETPDDLADLCDLAKKNLNTDSFTIATDLYVNGADSESDTSNLGAGDIVEFHMDDSDSKVVEAIYVSHYELDQISAVDDDVDDADAEDGVTCYVDFEGNGGTKVFNTDIPGFNARTYVEDAYVALLISDADGKEGTIVDSYIPETVEDSVTTKKSNNSELTIGKTKYVIANDYTTVGDTVAVSTVAPGADNTYTLYLDSNGYVLGIVEVEGEAAGIDDVYYLDAVWKVAGMSATYYAQIVKLDGTVSEIQLEAQDHTFGDSKNANLGDGGYSGVTPYADLRGRLVTISDKKVGSTSKANNNKYNLTEWNPTEDWDKDAMGSQPSSDLAKDDRMLGSYRLNGSTVYLFLEKTGDDLAVTRYVGGVAYDKDNVVANANASTRGSYVITEKDKTVAKYVIIRTEDASQEAEFSEDVIFIKSASTTKGDGYRIQKVYLPDGTEDDWNIDEDEYTTGGALCSFSDPAFFTYGENDDGYIVLDDPTEMTVDDDLDWQENKPEGVLAGVTFDDHNDLFEDMLTVSTEDPHTVTDIDVAGASFKDLRSGDDRKAAGQYDKAVTSLSALAKLIEDGKVESATLYMNVSKDGAVTIFVTDIEKGKTFAATVGEVEYEDTTNNAICKAGADAGANPGKGATVTVTLADETVTAAGVTVSGATATELTATAGSVETENGKKVVKITIAAVSTTEIENATFTVKVTAADTASYKDTETVTVHVKIAKQAGT